MRLTYILVVFVAATLHASGTPLPSINGSNQAAISNVASADIVHSLDATEAIGGRMLRKAKEDPVSEEDEEERAGGAFAKWFKQQGENLKFHLKKRVPGTHEYKLYQEVMQGKRNAAMLKRHYSGLRAGFGN